MTTATADAIRHPLADPPEPGAALEVAEGVFWLRLPFPGPLSHVNAYALRDPDGWTLVDTGLDIPETRAAWTDALAGPLGGGPVRRVLVTHHHPDHVGLAGWFQAVHGAELWMTRTAWLYARMLTLDRQEVPARQTLDYWHAAGMPADEVARRAAGRPFNFADVVHPMPLGFRALSGGRVLRLAGRDWDVRLAGGHAPDHATLWSRAGDLVIAGDQVLPGISPNVGVYATEPEADPLADWLASCARLSGHATAAQLVLPGHRRPFTGLPLRLRQLEENHTGALDRLEAYLDAPRSAVECFDTLYARPIGPGEYTLALGEAVAHLTHLVRRGRAVRYTDPGGVWRWRRRGRPTP